MRDYAGVMLMDRIGNNMYQIASVASYAHANEMDLKVFIPDTPKFVAYESQFMDNIYSKLDVSICHDFGNVVNLPWKYVPLKGRNVTFSGYMQSTKYLDERTVLGLFPTADEIMPELREMYGNLDDCVSVNVRRGDFLGLKNFFTVLDTPDWYVRAMGMFEPGTRFLVTSDDIEWCKANLVGENIAYADRHKTHDNFISTSNPMDDIEPRRILGDLYLQTLCGKGNIISASTFSWWGAYLNRSAAKRVVAPHPWFDRSCVWSAMADDCKTLPDSWIRLEV